MMKKSGILNQPISAIVAGLGHTDTVVVADAGLPIPAGPQRIDLALKQGVPTFLDTLNVVLSEMQIEKVIIADEMIHVSPDLYRQVKEIIGDVPVEFYTHVIFKEMTARAKAVIRTGDFIPYANIILVAGVVF